MLPNKVLSNGQCLFRIPQEPGINIAIAAIFSQFRMYRPVGEEPRLYYLTSPLVQYTEPITNEPYWKFANLQLGIARKVTFENIHNILLSSEAVALAVKNAYWSDMTLLKKGRKPSQNTWLENQVDLFLNSGWGVLLHEPVHISFRSDEYSLAYLDPALFVPGPMPSWDSFMSQMRPEMRPVFGAFIYSALDIQNQGRQILYIYDTRGTGRTGKTSISQALLAGAMSQTVAALSEDVLENEFGYAHFYGKRLLIHGDCQNPRILKNAKIHAISGGDLCPIVYKHQMAFTAHLHAKIIIMANEAPNIEAFKGHESSRLIAIELDESKCTSREHYDAAGNFVGNNSYTERLTAELPHFLSFCKEAYTTLCPTSREIIVPETMFDSTVSDYEDIFISVFKEFFEASRDYNITASQMYEILDAVIPKFEKSNKLKSSWKTFLETMDIRQDRFKIEGHRVRVFLGIRKKGGVNYSNLSLSNTLPSTFTSDNMSSDMSNVEIVNSLLSTPGVEEASVEIPPEIIAGSFTGTSAEIIDKKEPDADVDFIGEL